MPEGTIPPIGVVLPGEPSDEIDELQIRSPYREIDRLRGGDGNDTFVLGDEEYGAFYDDSNPFTFDTSDHALIEDFKLGEDTILLYGSEEDYYLSKTRGGMGIFKYSEVYLDIQPWVPGGDIERLPPGDDIQPWVPEGDIEPIIIEDDFEPFLGKDELIGVIRGRGGRSFAEGDISELGEEFMGAFDFVGGRIFVSPTEIPS